MRKQKVILILTGGLGNQLFQMRFVEYLQRTHKVEVFLDITLGRPRGQKNYPDSFEFGIPCSVIEKKYSKLASKSIGFLLRSGYLPRKIEELSAVKWLLNFTVSIIQSIHFRYLLNASAPTDLGFDSSFRIPNQNMLTMGYFQSHKYLPKPDENYKFLITPQSDAISKYRRLARTENPLIVHVRRGDYGSEDHFGLLGNNYYKNAIDQITSLSDFDKIWLFSDEPEKALALFSDKQKEKIRIIDEVDDSPAHTLEVMRFGSAYVIANSTFSWWAAKSAYNSSAPVAAPAKWFKSLRPPAYIIPESWHLIENDFL